MTAAFHAPTPSRPVGAVRHAYMPAMKPLLPALIALAAASTAAAAEPPIRPGCWESTNRVVSPIHQTTTTTRLISAADVDRFLTGPINHHYTCVYPTRRVGEGRLVMKGKCTDSKGRQLGVEGRGRYTATSFHVEATIAMNFLGLPVQGRATTDARRIGDSCPAEPAKS